MVKAYTRYQNGLDIGTDAIMVTNAGAPTSGAAGTFFGDAGPGSLLLDTTNGAIYINTNTKASPTWTALVSASAVPATVLNSTGSTIGRDVPVTITGSDATNEKITPADADAGAKFAHYITAASVLTTATTTAFKRGLSAANLATNGGSVGDPVYLSATAGGASGGGWTLTAPTAQNAIVQQIGTIVVSHATLGQILWDIQAPQKIGSNELQALSILTAAIGAAQVTAAKLTATMQLGTVLLRLRDARLAAYANIAAIGGILATDTNPSIGRRNAGTDPGDRVSWAAGNAAPISFQGTLPEDLDDTVDGVLYLTAGMAGATDTPVITPTVFVGIGGADLGVATTALSNAQVEKTSAVNFPASAAGKEITVTLTPGAHATDILRLDAIRLVYTRK